MSSFFAAAPAEAGQNDVENDGFFPTIDIGAASAAMRQDGTVTPERLRGALIEAMLLVNDCLGVWRVEQQAAGHRALNAVPATRVNGVSAHVHRYLRAVYCEARASLIERYRDYDATAAGDRKAEQLMPAADDLRRDARWAISDIVGRPRTTVELI